jgi:predicted ribosomally synthesized peptide with SipW-like signal peptide
VGVFGATKAFFTDTETSANNTFSAGTIDIAVDNNNPWTRKGYALTDMKPSQTDYIDFVVHNVGTNPVNLYKKLGNFVTSDGGQSESECLAENGSWDGEACTNRQNPQDNVDTQIRYDLRVELYNHNPETGGNPYWRETIYQDSDNVRLSALLNKNIYLGMIPAGHYLKVMQSYHLDSDTGNEYQGDSLSFDITLTAEQLGKSSLVLENKYLANTDVSHHVWNPGGVSDGKDAVLSYKIRERTFDYTLTVNGMPNGAYSLIAWEDPSLTWNWDNRGAAIKVADVNISGGPTVLTGNVELNRTFRNAKVWLIPGTYINGNASTFPWDPTNTLFETGLMDYYDADL